MTTTDKVQIGDSTTGTSTGTSYTWTSNPSYNTEKGWECPRCRRINAPWVRQCDCSGTNWSVTCDYREPWWKQVTCSSDTFKIHPESESKYNTATPYTIHKAPSSVCGTDNNVTHGAVYVTATNGKSNNPDMNSCTYEDSPWGRYFTYTSDAINKLQYQIEQLKETN